MVRTGHSGAGLLQYGQVGDKASPGATARAGCRAVFDLLVTIWVLEGTLGGWCIKTRDVIK